MKKIKRVFINVHMGWGYDRLTILAKENGITLDLLNKGEYLVFINTQKNAVKLMTYNGVVAYYRANPKIGISLEVIRHLPEAFNGVEINYDLALSKMIEKKLKEKEKNLIVL